MRFKRWFSAGLAVALASNACAGDDTKKVARDDDGGESGAEAAGAGDGGKLPGGGGTSASLAGEGGTLASTAGEGGALTSTAGEDAGGLGTAGETSGAPIALKGLVMGFDERPVAGVPIAVQGQSAVTDADGAFELDVLAPYDLVVGGTEAYLGLSRSDPKVYVNAGTNRSATLRGVISGGAGFPQPANHETHLTLSGGVAVTFGQYLAASSDGNYTSNGAPAWRDTPSVDTTLVGVQVDKTNRAIVALGAKAITLTDQEQLQAPEASLTLSPVTLHALGLNFTAPAGIAFTDCSVFIGGYSFANANPSSPVMVQVPDNLPEAVKLTVMVVGRRGDSYVHTTRTLPGNTTALDLDFDDPPALTAPANGATQASDTAFSFTRRAGTLAILNVRYSEIVFGGEGSIEHASTIYTNQTSVALSRLRRLSLDLGDGAPLIWNVTTLGDVSDVDTYTAPEHEGALAGNLRSVSEDRILGDIGGPDDE